LVSGNIKPLYSTEMKLNKRILKLMFGMMLRAVSIIPHDEVLMPGLDKQWEWIVEFGKQKEKP